MRKLRRASLIAGLLLGVAWIGWRGPHIADDIRYAVATPWPGAELTAADDGTIELGGRRIAVLPIMNVDCMPGVQPIPLPQPACRRPGMGVRLSAKSSAPTPALPRLLHARIESQGAVWVSDLVELDRDRYYDATFATQYAAAGAQRETPSWDAGRRIQVTVWLELQGRLYRIALPPTVISHSS
jgi:hypothetical protein